MDNLKYKCGDKVLFHIPRQVTWDGKVIREEGDIEGVVEIVDEFGTFEQHEEPSYDIYRKEDKMFYKHVRQSSVVKYLGLASEDERLGW